MKPFSSSSLSLVIVLFFTVLSLVGCTSNTKFEDGVLPELTFGHIVPLRLDIANVKVENNYTSDVAGDDVSASFPIPPDIVLRRYAEHRLGASGDTGILRFIIEDASVRHTYIEPKGAISKWARLSGKDRYDVSIRFRMHHILPDGSEIQHSVLTVENYLTMGESISISGREFEMLGFLETLMKDVDASVVSSLRETFNLITFSDEDIGLSTPELR